MIISLIGGLEHLDYFSIYWKCHNPNWRTHIFQRVSSTTNQISYCFPFLRPDGQVAKSPWPPLAIQDEPLGPVHQMIEDRLRTPFSRFSHCQLHIYGDIWNCDHMEVSIVMGVPQKRWTVDFMEHPILKWMIWGYPYFRKPPYVYIQYNTMWLWLFFFA